jgi:hypothetical protein
MKKKRQVLFAALTVISILLGFYIKSVSSDHLESFETFNIRFHSDSVFQISRINFPLEGKLVDGFEKQNWNSENWKLMKTPVTDKISLSGYKHSLRKTDEEVIEKFWIDNSGFKVERKFKRINGKWFLVFHADINL